jgi:pimeloyl-ACP methyl ester carboxylesterase
MSIPPSSNATGWRAASALAECCEAIYFFSWQTDIPTIALRRWGPGARCTFIDRRNNFPRFAVIRYPDTMIIIVEGTTSREQAELITLGYLNDASFENGGRINFFVKSAALQTNVGFIQALIDQHQNVVLAGHSIGGAIAQMMCAGYKQANTFEHCSAVSFGAPMWCDAAVAMQVTLVDTWRIMNRYDPIPSVWPTWTQAPLMNAAVGSGGRNARLYRQAGVGYQLEGNPVTWVVRYTADLRAPIAELDLQNLYSRHANGESTEHTMDTYRANVDNYLAQLDDFVAEGRRLERPAPRPEDLPDWNDRQQRIFLDRQIAERLDRLGPEVPVIERSLLFHAKKFSKWWGVTCGGEWIAWGMRRRRATHTAFLGNKLFREYLKVGLAFPKSFVNALDVFLTDAQDSDSGIRPTLNVEPLMSRDERRVIRGPV